MKFPLAHLTVVSALFLAACGSERAADAPAPPPPDKLTSTQWCTVDSLADNIQLVTRYSLASEPRKKAEVDYLTLTNAGAPVIYKKKAAYDWEAAKPGALSLSGRYLVALVEEPTELRSSYDYNKQSSIFGSSLRGNPNLKPASVDFAPSMAVSLKHVPLLSSKESEQILFPCATYSSTFAAEAPSHPMLELGLLVGQSVRNQSSDVQKNSLAKSMSLQFPVKQLNTKEANLDGTQWCAWYQSGAKGVMASIISFGDGSYVNSRVTEATFDDYYGRVDERLQEEAETAQTYSIVDNETYLSGESTLRFGAGSSMKVKDTFAIAQDAKGTRILVKMNDAYGPSDDLITHFDNIFFDCADPRPLELNENVKKYLAKFLALQKAKAGS